MKHILKHQQLFESLGKGSVLLIKSKPIDGKRFLFATNITGFVNIRPKVTMAFLGNQLYRVVHKGDSKFFGRKVAYENSGMLDMLNMKNPNVPSIILNNNKTPLHWLTLNHTNIGDALKAVEYSLIDIEDLNLT